MIKNRGIRRASAGVMVALGIALMLFAPDACEGALLFVLGVVLELVGIVMEHKT